MRGLDRQSERSEAAAFHGRMSQQAKQSHGEIAGPAFMARRFLAGPICVLMGHQKPSGSLPKSPRTHSRAPPL